MMIMFPGVRKREADGSKEHSNNVRMSTGSRNKAKPEQDPLISGQPLPTIFPPPTLQASSQLASWNHLSFIRKAPFP
jgi:hypothetical protein